MWSMSTSAGLRDCGEQVPSQAESCPDGQIGIWRDAVLDKNLQSEEKQKSLY